MTEAAVKTVTVDASAAITLGTQARAVMTASQGIIIDSQDMCELASDDLKRVKTLQKEVEEKRTSITSPLNQAVKAINDLFREPKEYLAAAEVELKKGITAWTLEQNRIAAEARAKAEAEAATERARLQTEAETQAAEAHAKQREAQQAQEAGDTEAAQRLMDEANAADMQAQAAVATQAVVTVAAPALAPAKVAGISTRMTYSAQVTDLLALVKAVAEGTAPIEAIQADTKFLGAQARAFKKQGQLYPGVEITAQASVAARAA